MKRTLQILLIAIPVSLLACTADRHVRSYSDLGPYERELSDAPEDALKLVVEVASDGTLTLNRIRTGSIENTTHLRDSVKAIFDDRKRNGIAAREVIVVLNGDVQDSDLNDLIAALESVDGRSLRIVTKVREP
jgi:hypothetical protein